MKTRRFPLWGNLDAASTSPGRDPRQVPAETDRLVHLRADSKCEACRAALKDTDACSWVYGALGWTDEDVYWGAANAVLLCPACQRLTDAFDPRMEARGFCVWSGPNPRLMPMVVPADDGTWRPVWRSEDGRYLLDPPELPSS